MKTLFSWISLTALIFSTAHATELIIKDKQDMDCYVYLPEPIDPAKTYQLIVGVHGARGNGKNAAGLKNWAGRGDVIAIGPSFDINGGFQGGDGVHAEKLIDLFETLKKTYKLRDKMFLYGFSAGSQFTHRFAMLHPKLVCGVAAHSGGTWATDNYGKIDVKAKDIPFAISCGEKDTGFSFGGAPFGRLDWFKRFQQEIDDKKFCYIGAVIPGAGHSMSGPAWDMTQQCFQLATGLPGKSATEKVEISPDWKNLDNLKANAPTPTRPSIPSTPAKPAISEAELDKIVQAAFKKADAEKVPDDLLVGFMKKYPPVLWKDKPGSEKLLEQCKSAAAAWQKAAEDKNMWNDSLKKQFAEFTEGLDLAK